jgi:two-component system, OmpR family, sensor histidine kinase KdpD
MKLSDSDKDELIAEISKASLKLNGQVENLLNMSRLESGVIKPIKDWCDVNELIYSVRNQLKEYTNDHIININIKDNLPLCKIDFGLIHQSVYNLIYNAIVYTPHMSVITVSAWEKANKLMITIEDNGIGFPESEIENVFEKFYRLKNSKTGGTGLGLSIVRGFIEAHDGNIKLENRKEGGAKFTITIPAEMSRANNLKNE